VLRPAICGGAFAPQGKAVVESGGYRASGRWGFASGCQHADWLFGQCVVLENGGAPLDAYGEVVLNEGDRVSIRVPKAETSRVAARLLAEHEVLDLTIEEPPIEDVIESVFAQPAAQ